MDLTLDIETFSRADLKKAGLAAYAQHKSTDILCACWAFGDGLVRAWVPTADEQFAIDMMRRAEAESAPLEHFYIGPETPYELVEAIKRGDRIHSYNAAFERSVLAGPAGKRYGFPKPPTARARRGCGGGVRRPWRQA